MHATICKHDQNEFSWVIKKNTTVAFENNKTSHEKQRRRDFAEKRYAPETDVGNTNLGFIIKKEMDQICKRIRAIVVKKNFE